MIYALIAYFVAFFLINLIISLKKRIVEPIFNGKITKFGVQFFSHKKHKLFVGEAKILQIETTVYIKAGNQTAMINNVANAFLHKNYVYFNSLGRVDICFDVHAIYRYFCISIESPKFSLTKIKAAAVQEILGNIFNYSAGVCLKKYLNIVNNILNINVTNSKLHIGYNRYHLPFTITYKSKGKIKKVNVN